ncbi:MAG: glutathione synthase [Arsenophonus sp.]|nr:MAG: glutathione synthase [Arsenophonus sp.]
MIKLGIVMNTIKNIDIKKDSSFAMLLEAQRRKYEIYYMEIGDLFLLNGEAYAYTKKIKKIQENSKKWYTFETTKNIALKKLNVILMRQDPPFNTEYIYATYILERAEATGTLIINKPQSLRDCNEKIFTLWFSKLTPKTLVTRNKKQLYAFYKKYQDIILKPLDKMGGDSIFRIQKNDPNINVIIETLIKKEKHFCMAQNFLPEINKGDKRVLMIDGEPIPYCLARIPPEGEIRGNLAIGGYGEVRKLTKSDWKIAKSVSSILKEKELIFVGLDIIGDRLTEINITSPTCIREIQLALPHISITGILFDVIEKKLTTKNK